MEIDSILKSVPYSEWANPIVIVPKPDGTIRICADYKRTVNPVTKNDTYPQICIFENTRRRKIFQN